MDTIGRISCLFFRDNMLNVKRLVRLNPLPLKDGLSFHMAVFVDEMFAKSIRSTTAVPGLPVERGFGLHWSCPTLQMLQQSSWGSIG